MFHYFNLGQGKTASLYKRIYRSRWTNSEEDSPATPWSAHRLVLQVDTEFSRSSFKQDYATWAFWNSFWPVFGNLQSQLKQVPVEKILPKRWRRASYAGQTRDKADHSRCQGRCATTLHCFPYDVAHYKSRPIARFSTIAGQ